MQSGKQTYIYVPALKTYLIKEARDKAMRYGTSLSAVIVRLVELWMWDGDIEEKVSDSCVD